MRALLAALLLFAVPAGAQDGGVSNRVVSSSVERTQLTLYPDDLALVTETRVVEVPAGRSTIAFEGVSDLIVPQSLVLRSFAGVSLERNFDYDLLGRAALYQNSVGERLRLTRIDQSSGRVLAQEAVIVAADADGGVVVETDAGYEGLFCSGLAVRGSFEGLPPGLAARPAMSVEVEAEAAGAREVVISYLTSGMGWAADYRLDLGPNFGPDFGEESADLLGWLSLNNRTAKRYEDVELAVIAGEVRRDPGTRGVAVEAERFRDVCWPVGTTKRGRVRPPAPSVPTLAAPMMADAMAESAAFDEIIATSSRRVERKLAVEEDFADYKLYRVPGRVTVGAYQTKQVAFVDGGGVEVERLYALDLDALEAELFALPVRYEIDNSRDGELARSLPEGTVRVFARAESVGRAYVGEDRIADTPVDQDAELVAGRSVDVFAKAEIIDDGRTRIALVNAGSETAVVEMTSRYAGVRVRGARRVEDEDTPTWRVEVGPRERVDVRVRAR